MQGLSANGPGDVRLDPLLRQAQVNDRIRDILEHLRKVARGRRSEEAAVCRAILQLGIAGAVGAQADRVDCVIRSTAIVAGFHIAAYALQARTQIC